MEHFKVFLHSGGIFPHKCLLTDLALAPGAFLVQLWIEDLDGVKLTVNIGEIDLWFLHLVQSWRLRPRPLTPPL